VGVLSRLKKRVGGTARLAKDALSALTSSRAPDAGAGPAAAATTAAPTAAPITPAPPVPVDATDRTGERLWYLDGQQADAGWEQTNPAEAPEPRGAR
jgi:hypothetical protein